MMTILNSVILAFAVASPAATQDDSHVAFGVLAFAGEADAHVRWDDTIKALSAAIPDRHFELLPLTLDGAKNALEARTLHFLLTNPGHFQSLMMKHELAPLVSLRTDAPGGVKTENRYGAVIFARASEDSPRRLADLRGLKFGAVAPDAFGGWQLALHTLRRNGLEPQRDFTELRFFGFPQSSIVSAVLDGEIDAGTVRTGVLEGMVAAGQLSQGDLVVLNPLAVPSFELLLSTALIPEWLVAATPLAQADLRRAVARVLLDIEPSRDKGTAAWQPPQSIAPVVEVFSALLEFGGEEAKRGWSGQLVTAAAVLFGLLVLISLRRFRPIFSGPTPHVAETDSRTLPEDIPVVSLTGREVQILELVKSGQTSKEIARVLSISPKTVEFHRHNLMQKFEASNMADLVHRSRLWEQ